MALTLLSLDDEAPKPTKVNDPLAAVTATSGALDAANDFSFPDFGVSFTPQPKVPGAITPAPTTGPGGEFNGFPTDNDGGDVGQAIVNEAMKYIGVPYKYGGNGPTIFDCSGLTRWAYLKAAGISLPRISYQQSNGGTRESLANAKPGDMIFWDNSDRNPGADHVAIYIGDGKIIEAPSPGKNVQVRTLGTWSLDSKAWAVTYRSQYGA